MLACNHREANMLTHENHLLLLDSLFLMAKTNSVRQTELRFFCQALI